MLSKAISNLLALYTISNTISQQHEHSLQNLPNPSTHTCPAFFQRMLTWSF